MQSILSLRGLAKSFGGVPALAPLDLDLAAGDILGLVGENGAGKSTLIKLLSGVHRPDAGRIEYRGSAVRFGSPRDALAAGIATIYQELEYIPTLTVAENMLLGERWPRTFWGGVAWKRLHAEARRRLADSGVGIPTTLTHDRLTAAQKQEVAIATSLSRAAKLLILDEPTASLSEPEVQRLLESLRPLARQGIAVIYVSHRLDEIFAITNRIAVLRDGRLVATHTTTETDVNAVICEMVGHSVEQSSQRGRSLAPGSAGGQRPVNVLQSEQQPRVGIVTGPATGREPLLEVKRLTRSGLFQDVNFEVCAGEIVGMAGLVGAGRSEVARAVYGMYSCDAGKMRLMGKSWRPTGPDAALNRGLVYIPEERKGQGLVLDHSLRESISIGISDLFSWGGVVSRRRESQQVKAAIQKYDIRSSSAAQPIGTLSGGNQQKALLARWLERDPSVIILDEPTRGVDVGAKSQIHALIRGLAASGKGVLLISSDLPEVLALSDRVLVMNRGTIGVELRGADMTSQNVLLAASGLPPAGPVPAQSSSPPRSPAE